MNAQQIHIRIRYMSYRWMKKLAAGLDFDFRVPNLLFFLSFLFSSCSHLARLDRVEVTHRVRSLWPWQRFLLSGAKKNRVVTSAAEGGKRGQGQKKRRRKMTKPRNKESVWSCREEESASKSYTFQNKFLSVRIVELGIWCCTFNFKNPCFKKCNNKPEYRWLQQQQSVLHTNRFIVRCECMIGLSLRSLTRTSQWIWGQTKDSEVKKE